MFPRETIWQTCDLGNFNCGTPWQNCRIRGIHCEYLPLQKWDLRNFSVNTTFKPMIFSGFLNIFFSMRRYSLVIQKYFSILLKLYRFWLQMVYFSCKFAYFLYISCRIWNTQSEPSNSAFTKLQMGITFDLIKIWTWFLVQKKALISYFMISNISATKKQHCCCFSRIF